MRIEIKLALTYIEQSVTLVILFSTAEEKIFKNYKSVYMVKHYITHIHVVNNNLKREQLKKYTGNL